MSSRARRRISYRFNAHVGARPLLSRWRTLLRRTLEEILVLVDPRPSARELRHVTTFAGVLAQGVTEATAVLPSGWRDRLIPFEIAATGNVTASCLEPHDLWISKAIANRPKDIEFCDALLERAIIDTAMLGSREARGRSGRRIGRSSPHFGQAGCTPGPPLQLESSRTRRIGETQAAWETRSPFLWPPGGRP